MATDIILRSVKAAALTHAEMDQNWESLAQTIDVIASDATVAITDQNKILECDIASGTLTLPTVVNAAGTDTDSFQITFKNINATALTINGNGGELIEGQNTFTLLQNEAVNLGLSGDSTSWIYLNVYNAGLLGITASAAELSTMEGITASTDDLNIVTGKTLASTDSVIDNFPSGTLMLFPQTASPTGWTKSTTHDNKALRVVTGAAGAAGATPFTSVFGAAKATDGLALTTAQIPAHTHGSAGSHTHTLNALGGGNASFTLFGSDGGNTVTTNAAGAHTHSSVGSNSPHSHGIANFDLQYVDTIIATKD